MNPLELVAVLLGVANIVLLARRSVWNYPFGLAMVSLYAVIFTEARLYSDALLQVFFFVIQCYGWWHWHQRADHGVVAPRRLSMPALGLTLIAVALAALVWGWGMQRFTDAAAPFWDAAIAMTSIAAQILLARRFIQNWWLWIAVDTVAVPLFWSRNLPLTAGLYALFLVLSVIGLVAWERAAREARQA